MTKKMAKALSILLVAALMLGIAATPVLASATLEWNSIAITSDTSGNTATAAKNISGQIIGVVQVIGVAVAVIMLIVLAIKYISAAPNDKAEIKKHAVVYVVGAVVLFAASGILEIIKNFANQVKA
ncbi:MAG: hypothetical protein IKP28_02605 [Clostridia bacterium]|nr:hypothetical protein [Clostridia bacterium]